MILPVVAELLARAGSHAGVREALDELRGGAAEVRLAGLTATAKALLAAHAAVDLQRRVILVVESNQRADALAEPLGYFYEALSGKPRAQVETLPAHDVLPYQTSSPHPEISEARAVALWRWTTGQARILVTPVTAAMMRLRPAEFYRGLARTLVRDEESSLEEFLTHLSGVGYERQELVEMPGQFSLRGGIVDVYSPESLRPVRVELFGDRVESLREFNPETQRSVRPLERATFLPLTDYPRRSEVVERFRGRASGAGGEAGDGLLPGWEFDVARLAPGMESLAGLSPGALLMLDEPDEVREAQRKYGARLAEAHARAVSGSGDVCAPDCYFFLDGDWPAGLAAGQRLVLEHLAVERAGTAAHAVHTQPTLRYHGNVAAFMAEARQRVNGGEQVMVATATTGELERLADLCHDYEMAYRLGERDVEATMTRLADDSSAGSVPAVTLVKAPLAEGVIFPDAGLVIHGNGDLFEAQAAASRMRPRAKTAGFFSDFSDVKAGDYVVHVDHGIGQFEGLREVESDGAAGEFMLLRYADDARLYLPVARMDLVQKYRTIEAGKPQLDKLGGATWESRKSRVKKAVAEMAEKLLRLYAERKTVAGNAFSRDVPWQREFEDAFEFEETPGQAAAIEEVKRDMERPLPMDRLLCGDVGYGKTEVAMRAIFKAVCDGKQAALLAPTTVLVFQHYETFRKRFSAFPMRVGMLSRFRSAREQKKTLEELESGKLDIVVGTHRLLSRDLRFQDLGLLVVDEEQRFGVAHKERLKELRKNVDVLTMSATPIPRTLHMSLAGLRDMSVIETPPKDRLAIQTVVAPFEERLIQSAIEEEMARQGQVYFVHNRVQSIASIAALIQRLAPRARVAVGHGQMDEKQLERVMLRFIQYEADVLVSTTIIENGLDIPRVNTIFVNRADRFGLAELYQLRGRVGRSNLRAYAYLLVPRDASLAPLARRRLAALKEFSELGAGFRIAALDLELRGAGNLLGPEQHGHINAIGFDLYCQMMERAVAVLKGEEAAPERRSIINLGLEIRIAPAYIYSENQRLQTYKRIAGVRTDAEREEVERELEDRFGPPPEAVRNLLEYAVLKALCEKLQVASVERRGEQVAVKFHEETPVEPRKVVQVVRKSRGARFDPSGVLWLGWEKGQARRADALRNVLLQLQP